jgi:nicotinamide-nucleotide amidase
VTRDVIAELLGRKLIFQPQIAEKIRSYFVARKLVPPDMVNVQAQVPEGADVLENNHGTAPGFALEEKGKLIVVLPGPPRELKPMWEEQAIPWLLKRLPQSAKLLQRIWRIQGLGESRVQEMLETRIRALGEFEIGYCARPGEVDFRLISTDAAALEAAETLVRQTVGEHIYAEGDADLAQVVIERATALGKTIATAESCTGGLVAHRLTNIPGSSAVFTHGWVTYANAAKIGELGVSPGLIETDGAVSEAVVRAMAEGARRQSGADLVVALTGIAGPAGGTPEKPVGYVWIALASAKETIAVQKNLSRDRETFKWMASQVALDLIRKALG